MGLSARRPKRMTGALLVALGLGACAAPPRPAVAAAPEALAAKAARIQKSAIVIDTHNDVTTAILDDGYEIGTAGSLGEGGRKAHTDLAQMKSSGLTAEFFAIYVDRKYAEAPPPEGGSARRALEMIDATYRTVAKHPQELVLATRADEIRKAKRDGKIAILMGIEGGHAIEDSLGALRMFYALGVRYMTLTHTNTNDWADSAGSGDPPVVRHHGLSKFGEAVVVEMQRLGMLVDISHVSDETFYAVLRVAKAPIIASHSSMRALTNHPRNLTDDMLRALAKNGGVVMVNFFSGFIDEGYLGARRAFAARVKPRLDALKVTYKGDEKAAAAEEAKIEKEFTAPRPKLGALIDHIDHAVKIAGVDHVGLGSDFDGVPSLPEGIDGIGDLPKITGALLARGYDEASVVKILGGNFLRVMDAAERAKENP